MGGCSSTNQIHTVRPFKSLIDACTRHNSTIHPYNTSDHLVREYYPDRYAEFLYFCHARFNDQASLLNALCRLRDVKYTLLVLQQPGPLSKTNGFTTPAIPFYKLTTETVAHMFDVARRGDPTVLERYIAHLYRQEPTLALMELFRLGNRRSSRLNSLFFSRNKGQVSRFCIRLESLGLSDDTLVDIVGHGVVLDSNGNIECKASYRDVMELVISWNVFQGSHAGIARMICDMIGICPKRRLSRHQRRRRKAITPRNDPNIRVMDFYSGPLTIFGRERLLVRKSKPHPIHGFTLDMCFVPS